MSLPGAESHQRSREKLRQQFREGKLDERMVELDVRERNTPQFGIISNQNLEDMEMNLKDMLPNIFGGLKVAITLAVVGSIVAEFVGADRGLGYLLMTATGNLDTTFLFADLVVLVALGVVLYVVIEVMETAFIPWHVSKRSDEIPEDDT